MRAVFRAAPVGNTEITHWRVSFFCQWVAIFGLLPWLLWVSTVTNQNVCWPVGLSSLTVLSVLAGWQLGYRRLIGLTGIVR